MAKKEKFIPRLKEVKLRYSGKSLGQNSFQNLSKLIRENHIKVSCAFFKERYFLKKL